MAKTTNIYSVIVDNNQDYDDHHHFTLVVASDSEEEAIEKAKKIATHVSERYYSFEADLEFEGVILKEEE